MNFNLYLTFNYFNEKIINTQSNINRLINLI